MLTMVFLDATKAFDRVEYCKLFDTLLVRNLPPVFIRLLLNMYTSHVTRIMWNVFFSDRFSVCNGVKQGGVLSPLLFCIYIDGLLQRLSSSRIGCNFGTIYIGVLAYADDIVLLALLLRCVCSCQHATITLMNTMLFLTPKILNVCTVFHISIGPRFKARTPYFKFGVTLWNT